MSEARWVKCSERMPTREDYYLRKAYLILVSGDTFDGFLQQGAYYLGKGGDENWITLDDHSYHRKIFGVVYWLDGVPPVPEE